MTNLPLASLGKRLASILYETLLVLALLFVADYVFIALTQNIHPAHRWLQWWLLGVMAVYFSWSWSHGQTLAMKTWRIRVIRQDGHALSVGQALLRFSLACSLLGISQLWVLIDREHLFLHDRLAGTRLVTSS